MPYPDKVSPREGDHVVLDTYVCVPTTSPQVSLWLEEGSHGMVRMANARKVLVQFGHTKLLISKAQNWISLISRGPDPTAETGNKDMPKKRGK
jgi:hypothetical protein